MKKVILVILAAIFMLPCQAKDVRDKSVYNQDASIIKGSLTISSTPDLFSLTSRWANDYSAINPQLKIEVVSLTETKPAGALHTEDNLTFVSSEYITSFYEGSPWKMVVGRDAIVPVINSQNPFLNEISSQGISAEEFSSLIKNPDKHTWATLLEGVKNTPVDYYQIDNVSIKSSIANFINANPLSVTGISVPDGPGMVAAIQKNPYAIGFCKWSDITDPSGQKLVGQISLLPIDKNGNGKMDYIEKIYDNVATFSRGIWIGKYPQDLCRNLYVCSRARPDKDKEIAFLKFVLTSGQLSLDRSGFNSLAVSERLSKMDRLPATFIKDQTSDGLNITQLIITILAGITILLAILFLVIRYMAVNKPIDKKTASLPRRAINEASLAVPKGLYFNKTHTWVFMERNGNVKIGIDDFLQHVTGPITNIKMKKPGDTVRMGESVMTIIQNGKRLIIGSPISGIIRAENTVLFTNPSMINSSPFADGWIYLIEPTNWSREIQFLFMSEKYVEWLKNEFSRLKDFLARAIKPNAPEYAHIVLQDGGEITDHVLENLGPEVWEDFQTNFIDTSN